MTVRVIRDSLVLCESCAVYATSGDCSHVAADIVAQVTSRIDSLYGLCYADTSDEWGASPQLELSSRICEGCTCVVETGTRFCQLVTITSRRTLELGGCTVTAKKSRNGWDITIPGFYHTSAKVFTCEHFEIDSTLRPVFEFSERHPEPPHMTPYVPVQSMRTMNGFSTVTSPSGDSADFIRMRTDGSSDTIYWLRSELWSEMDSSCVEEYGKYCVSSGWFEAYSAEAVKGLSCHGYDIDADGNIFQPYDGSIVAEVGSSHYWAVICECAVMGNSTGQAWNDSGNNLRKLLQAARAAV